jgi:hypothetical protein
MQDEVKKALDRFHKDTNLSQFVDIGDATAGKLAKLANFVSESVSSQSRALGTGAPSQTLNFYIYHYNECPILRGHHSQNRNR